MPTQGAGTIDFTLCASLSISPPLEDPSPKPAALTLVQQIPEANLSLRASDAYPLGLYREPDSLKSITLLGHFTIHSGRLGSIPNGFGIFFIDPPEAVPAPALLPLCGAGMAFGYGQRLRRGLLISRQHQGDLRCGSYIAQLGRAPALQASPPPRTGVEGRWCLLASSLCSEISNTGEPWRARGQRRNQQRSPLWSTPIT